MTTSNDSEEEEYFILAVLHSYYSLLETLPGLYEEEVKCRQAYIESTRTSIHTYRQVTAVANFLTKTMDNGVDYLQSVLTPPSLEVKVKED